MSALTFDDEELQEITGGYVRAADQLRFLLSRGFHRAVLHRGRVLLERSHYDASHPRPDCRRSAAPTHAQIGASEGDSMSSIKGPVKGTFIVSGRYYLVRADGKRRLWIKLTKVTEGLPAFYAAMAEATKAPTVADDLVPKVIATWEIEVMASHAESTQRDERARVKIIADEFEEFRACDVQLQDITGFLAPYRNRPKTFNMMRAQSSDLMRFAIEKGWREPGSHPITGIIQTMSTPPRDRYPTDSEVRRIKVAGIYGRDGKKTRSGLMLAALVDMAYLTGQRISDLLALEWSSFGREGIVFKPSKTSKSTGASVLIEWTPKLRDVERRLRELRKERRAFGPWVFTKQTGQQYTY